MIRSENFQFFIALGKWTGGDSVLVFSHWTNIDWVAWMAPGVDCTTWPCHDEGFYWTANKRLPCLLDKHLETLGNKNYNLRCLRLSGLPPKKCAHFHGPLIHVSTAHERNAPWETVPTSLLLYYNTANNITHQHYSFIYSQIHNTYQQYIEAV